MIGYADESSVVVHMRGFMIMLVAEAVLMGRTRLGDGGVLSAGIRESQ